jgi:hypothetical protein
MFGVINYLTELPEAIIKIAAAGTGAICVLAVIASGYTIFKLPDTAPPAKHANVRWFMLMCFGFAALSAVASFGAAYWDYKGKQILISENEGLKKDLRIQQQNVSQLREQSKKLETQETILADLARKAGTSASIAKELDGYMQSTKMLRLGLDNANSQLATYAVTGAHLTELQAATINLKGVKEDISLPTNERVAAMQRLKIAPEFKKESDNLVRPK